ncbi:MAG: ribonuclease H-like domain-containing protein [Spirochaetes bacterium]|nr:ribonuclease H-like domain-containing protein [Spirochaetota bacterium]
MENKNIFEESLKKEDYFIFKKKIFIINKEIKFNFFTIYLENYLIDNNQTLSQIESYKTSLENKKNFDKEKIIFIDLETNGLYGSGNLAFLYGLGFFSNNNFNIYQIIIKEYSSEKKLLDYLTEFLEKFDIIITYNGDRFDLEILKTRAILNRNNKLINVIDNKYKIDLYRLLKIIINKKLYKIYGNFSLSLKNIEKNLLKIERLNDIDASIIPEYFKIFMNTGDISYINKISFHNFIDIYSMKKLLFFIEENFFNEKYFDLFNLVNYFIRKKNFEKSIKILELIYKNKYFDKIKYYYYLIKIYKKKRLYNEIDSLFSSIPYNLIINYFPLLDEFIKYYEWIKKDYYKIISLYNKSIHLLNLNFEPEKIDLIKKKIKRINNKIETNNTKNKEDKKYF